MLADLDDDSTNVNLISAFGGVDIDELEDDLEGRIYLTRAGLRNLTLCGDFPPEKDDGYLRGVVHAAYTRHCFIDNCLLQYNDQE